jgi:hypothetical protein
LHKLYRIFVVIYYELTLKIFERLTLKGKHTSKWLILIAGIIIFAHAIIPHHHHFDSIESHPENLECENTIPDKHNENPDKHCHAFNLIISEKEIDIVVNSPIESDFYFDLFCIETNPEITVKINDLFKTCYFVFTPQKKIFLTSHSLRAPPVTA